MAVQDQYPVQPFFYMSGKLYAQVIKKRIVCLLS